MAIDFFERQEEAHHRTGWLIGYFALAVILITLAVYLAFTFIIVASNKNPKFEPPIFDPMRLAAISIVTWLVIFLGSIFKIISLREGGSAVARMLNGRLVEGTTTDLVERRLLNVVEEMALASGVPVPPVYMMEEEHGINAFAAGHSPSDVVIGVTRGSVERLTRDQLQGVIGHEFSHVLNGDMRLDLRLLGLLNGILLIAIIGEILMRSTQYRSSGRSNRDDKDNGAMALLVLGIALFVIGYIGLFFGRLIKAAVSRQREFLADASAVQFTRQADGIAGALKTIGGFSAGSKVENVHAEQACHMFFGQAVSAMTSLMATHPPLEERILRLDSSFDGTYPEVDLLPPAQLREDDSHARSKSRPRDIGGLGAVLPGVARAGGLGGSVAIPAAVILDSVGNVRPEHVAYASNLLSQWPDPVVAAAREPFGAAALIFALLLDDNPEIRNRQLQLLRAHGAPGMDEEAVRLAPVVTQLGPESRVPLVDMVLPALRRLSPAQYEQFRGNIDPQIMADSQVTLFEFVLQRMLLRHLDRQFRRTSAPTIKYTSLAPVWRHCQALLSALARLGHHDPAEIERAFRAGAARLGPEGASLTLAAPEECSLPIVDEALSSLNLSVPAVKKQVLEACVACIGADGHVTLEEGELLRAIADALDCPMPPLVATT